MGCVHRVDRSTIGVGLWINEHNTTFTIGTHREGLECSAPVRLDMLHDVHYETDLGSRYHNTWYRDDCPNGNVGTARGTQHHTSSPLSRDIVVARRRQHLLLVGS